jgi:nuclear cap-binding protein subunit 1
LDYQQQLLEHPFVVGFHIKRFNSKIFSCKELLNYQKRNTVPLNHMIVEVVFSQLFRLPKAPHLELFYGAILIELCRVQSSAMPPLLADVAESFYKRARSFHPICLDR